MPHRSRPPQGNRPAPVLARLQGLFPPSPSHPTAPQHDKALPSLPTPQTRKALKIRILTWNMHDSVPKGDLGELFGKVPLWSPSTSTPADTIPSFTADADHPYHLVVVAGQECPSLSGIPMGLGAGFKLIDKDKDRDRDADKLRSRHSLKEPTHSSKASSPERAHHNHLHDPPSGWTSLLESYLCSGSPSPSRANSSPTIPDISSPKPLSPRPPSLKPKEPKKGPYVLLVKERMMGIYLAIFVHREMLHLVQGTSKSAVTAGLIGGRVGNKGGVGITLNVAGTTFLFLNAHLAAHEGKVNHRLSNLAKIKAELSVDDFLANDDPRVMAEDLTDKFDHTFLFGDLNFRLDISRLHADWLMSRKEYAQALAFDQLTNLMKSGTAFVGFHEAPISFPPTFKYDVLRTLKHAKRRGSRMDRWRKPGERSHRLTEVEEKELEELEKKEREAVTIEGEEGDEGEGEEGEGASMASSVWTSAPSTRATERDMLEDDDYFSSPLSQMTGAATASTSKLPRVLNVAHKAKTKWLSLLSSGAVAKLKPKSPLQTPTKKPLARVGTHSSAETPSHGLPTPVNDKGSERHLRPPPMILVNNATRSSLPSTPSTPSLSGPAASGDADVNANNGLDKGVYDSSHKKRVPSWCDRILWKTTVEPEPEAEPEAEPEGEWMRPRTRVGQFFVNAFRPLSARVRKDSVTSGESVASESLDETHTNAGQVASPEFNVLEDSSPLTRFSPLQSSSRPTSPSGSPPHARGKSPTRQHTHPEISLRRASSISAPAGSPQGSWSSSGARDPQRRMTASGITPPSLFVNNQYPPTNDTPAPSSASTRWRFFPSIFSYNNSTSVDSSGEVRRGDVVCLGYDTLDDGGMVRLEGRSDHRPVIGSYAVYV